MIYEKNQRFITLRKSTDKFANIMLGFMEIPYLNCIFAFYLEIIYISYD